MKFVSIYTNEPANQSLYYQHKYEQMGALVSKLMGIRVHRASDVAIFDADSQDEAIAITHRFLDLVGTGTCELQELKETPCDF